MDNVTGKLLIARNEWQSQPEKMKFFGFIYANDARYLASRVLHYLFFSFPDFSFFALSLSLALSSIPWDSSLIWWWKKAAISIFRLWANNCERIARAQLESMRIENAHIYVFGSCSNSEPGTQASCRVPSSSRIHHTNRLASSSAYSAPIATAVVWWGLHKHFAIS